MYFPLGQVSHLLSLNCSPAAHVTHALRSDDGILSLEQGVQLSLPTAPAVELCVLSPHSSQKVAESAPLCPAAMYRPAAHSVHEAEAGDELYVPGEHGSHCAAPSWGWY